MERQLSEIMTLPRLLPGLVGAMLVWGAGGGGGSPRLSRPPARGVTPPGGSCRACHQEIVDSFVKTAHARTSAEATARSVKGRFAAGQNMLRTRAPGVYFKMERRGAAFYETGVDTNHGSSRAERIDLVIGSGRRGQTYLYWRNGLLFELPVSYLTGMREWINSPGYRDGEIDFGRLIVPRCLECHTTSFPPAGDARVRRYSRAYVLGISCEKCHGDGRRHVEYHSAHPADSVGRYILNPGTFSRDRKVDTCALCHSGARDPKRPPFSYRPGEPLDDYLVPLSDRDVPTPDVHGNQIGLLRRSKCFRSSPGMACSTCHDVHQPKPDLAWFAQKCLGCHQVNGHPGAEQIGARMMTSCIDCHMPNRRSRAIEINMPTRRLALYYRSHAIGIYPEVAAAVLRSHTEQPDP